jgi:hypothetical protein
VVVVFATSEDRGAIDAQGNGKREQRMVCSDDRMVPSDERVGPSDERVVCSDDRMVCGDDRESVVEKRRGEGARRGI